MRRSLLLIPLAAAIMAPTLLYGPGWTHSAIYNFIWVKQFGAAISAGQLYPRWLPDSFEGLGSPTFFFYPPMAFWLSGGLNAAGLTTLQAINAAGFLLLLGSGFAMYGWLARRGTRPLLGASLYMLAPYHLVDLYVRGALAEFAAFVWIPLIALAIEALPKRWAWPLLAASFAALILSHLPVALLVSVFLMAPLLICRIREDRATFLPAVTALAAGVALAAFYLVPALTLQGYISKELLWGAYYQPANWSIWKAGFGFLGGLPLIGIGLALLATASRSRWTLIALVAAAAALGLIPLIWKLPLLEQAQFPWRLLCVVEFAAITAMLQRPPRPLIIAGAAAVLLVPYIFGSVSAAAYLLAKRDYSALERTMPDAPEYLPKGFDVSEVEDLQRVVDLSRYRALPRGDAVTVAQPGLITLHHAAFPIWKVVKDGQDVPTTGPLISFQATPGVYRVVRVQLWQERVGALISLFGLTLLALALLRTARSYNFRLSPRFNGSGSGSSSPTN